MKRVRGFTLIEMVIALAIAAMLVASVWTTTQSMAAVAARQREDGKMIAQRDRFIAIMRRDLQGRVHALESAKASSQGIDTDLMTFETLADPLAVYGSESNPAGSPPRMSSVQYTVHSGPKCYEIVRSESRQGHRVSILTIFRTNSLPSIEFFADGRWSRIPAEKRRDAGAIRLHLDGEAHCIAY